MRKQALMLELAPVLVRDPSDAIIYWSRGTELMHGFSKEEALGRVSHQLLQTQFPEPMEGILARLRSGRDWQGELRHIRRDGTPVFVFSQWTPQLDERGNLSAIIEVNSNITERKRAEAERARLAAIIDSSEDAIISKDLQGRVASWNASAQRLYGYSAQEIIGQPITRLIPPELQGEEATILARLRRGERIEHYETVRLAKDGRRIDVSLTISPVRDAMGVIIGASKIARDITERKQTERALRESEARKAAILESALDCIITIDGEGKIVEANPAVEKTFGHAPQEMIGKPMAELIIPARLREAHQRSLARYLAAGESPAQAKRMELPALRRGGTEFPAELTISALRINGTTYLTCTLRDITERKRAEAALRAAMDQLAQSNRELENRIQERTARLRESVDELEAFSYSLSHDLRAPLRAIQGIAQLALLQCEGKVEAPTLDLLQRIVNAGRRMDRMIQDVLTLSRMARQDMALGPVEVEGLVGDIIRERPELQSPRAEVTIQSPLLPMKGDTTSLTQCLTNLLSNAVKFVNPGVQPQVRIYSELAGENVRLWVADNGIGIPREAQQRIFEIFHRLHRTDQYEGTGLGLAIVLKAIERMGGKVGVESEPGRGSRFWLELPKA